MRKGFLSTDTHTPKLVRCLLHAHLGVVSGLLHLRTTLRINVLRLMRAILLLELLSSELVFCSKAWSGQLSLLLWDGHPWRLLHAAQCLGGRHAIHGVRRILVRPTAVVRLRSFGSILSPSRRMRVGRTWRSLELLLALLFGILPLRVPIRRS